VGIPILMTVDSTVAYQIPLPKPKKGIWTCMVSVMVTTSAGCTPEMALCFDHCASILMQEHNG